MWLSKVWTFPEGGCPPLLKDNAHTDHEALMIINPNYESTNIHIKIFFEGQSLNEGHKPFDDFITIVESGKVLCFRLGRHTGRQVTRVGKGRYGFIIESELPVAAQFGPIDLLQPNLSFYNIPGYSLG